MKKIIAILAFGCLVQLVSGQSCGFYEIQYIGRINSEQDKLVTIHLPSSYFWHMGGKVTGDFAFQLNDKSIDILTRSHLTDKFASPMFLLNLYKEKLDYLPLKLEYDTGKRKNKTIMIKIPIEAIQIQIKESENKVYRLIIDLGEINC